MFIKNTLVIKDEIKSFKIFESLENKRYNI